MKKVFGVLAILLVAGLVMMGCASPTNSNSTVGDPSFRSLSDGVIDSWNSVKGNTGTGGDQPIGDNNPNEKNRTGSWFTYLTFGTGYIVTPVWEWVKDGEYPSDNPQYSGSDSATGYGTDKDGNGGTINNGSNSWFMYNKYNGTAYNTQIVAGNPKNKINVVGTLNFSAPVDGKVTVSINLNDNVKSSDGVYQFWAGKSDLMPPKSPGQFNKDTDPRCIGGYSGANTQWTFAYPGNTVNIAVHLSVTYLVSAGGGGGGEYGHWVQTGEKITGNYDDTNKIMAGQVYYAGDIIVEDLGDGTLKVTFYTPYANKTSAANYSLGVYTSLDELRTGLGVKPNGVDKDGYTTYTGASAGQANYKNSIVKDDVTGLYYAIVPNPDGYDNGTPIGVDEHGGSIMQYDGNPLYIFAHVAF